MDAPLASAPVARVVWLAEPPGARTPTEEARGALEAWARARGVRLVEPGPKGEEPPRAGGAGTGEDLAGVEDELRRAREALAALDYEAAERDLARAETRVRDNPGWPQAAWLAAEVQRGWSARWLRQGDEARAERAWRRAEALDGGREAGLGEKKFTAGPRVTMTLGVNGGGALRVDGATVAPGALIRGEGEHAIAVVRDDGAIAWAGWIAFTPGGQARLAIDATVPCSRADLGRVTVAEGQMQARGVRCGRWVAAVPLAGAVRVATCRGETCEPWSEERAGASATAARPEPGRTVAPSEPARPRWPAWAGWALAVLGVAGAAVGIAAAAGAFRSSPNETRFVNGGLQIQSF
ncbi:MAG TPA: hypothetical protein VGI39_08680 [Polyangiaceae bacterium]